MILSSSGGSVGSSTGAGKVVVMDLITMVLMIVVQVVVQRLDWIG